VKISGPQYRTGASSVPMVDIAAARERNGKLVLAIVNTDPNKSAHVSTNLPGTAHGRILTGSTMDAHNTFDAPNIIHPVAFDANGEGDKIGFDIPSKSVAVVEIQ
jgi:alpha-L-arabinofuranosidase